MSHEHTETEISEEFGDGKALNTGATEHLMSSRIKKFLGNDGPNFFKNPVKHLKHNSLRIVFSSVAAAGIAYLAKETGLTGQGATDLNVAVTGLMGYPIYKGATNLLGGAGYLVGHTLNAAKNDRYIERILEPMGLGAGTAGAAVVAFFGASHADTYLEVAKNLTYRLPATITAGIPSFMVDTFTSQSNTSWDAVWERDDQLSCLGLQAANPEHICKSGPGSEFIDFTVGNDNTYSVTITDKDGFEASQQDYDYWDSAWASTKNALGIGTPSP